MGIAVRRVSSKRTGLTKEGLDQTERGAVREGFLEEVKLKLGSGNKSRYVLAKEEGKGYHSRRIRL